MSHPNAASSTSTGTGTGTGSNNNWRNPSSSHMAKYNLRQLPQDFAPTVEEQQLLDMYDVLRNHERVAARLKEEAARAKLAARDAEFQRQLAPLKKNKRKRNKPKATNKPKQTASEDENDDDLDEEDEDSDDVQDGDDNDDDDDDDADETLHDRREAKLAELREEVEEARHAIAPPVDRADALREQHLAVAV
jgi:hypothetical protein